MNDILKIEQSGLAAVFVTGLPDMISRIARACDGYLYLVGNRTLHAVSAQGDVTKMHLNTTYTFGTTVYGAKSQLMRRHGLRL